MDNSVSFMSASLSGKELIELTPGQSLLNLIRV